jgi:hypothetical protein
MTHAAVQSFDAIVRRSKKDILGSGSFDLVLLTDYLAPACNS